MNLKKRLITAYKNNITFRKLITSGFNILNHNSKTIKGDGNKIVQELTLNKNFSIYINGDNNTISTKDKSRFLNTEVKMRGNGHKLIIGENCIIGNTVFWFEDSDCSITIGDGTSIEGAHIAVTEPNSSIQIGKDCMLSSGIDIRNGDSHSIIDINSGKRINYARDINIGNHVWIGNGVEILKGVTVGDESVIGIKSLVSKDVPSHSVAAGIPAKIIKTDITWDRKRIYD